MKKRLKKLKSLYKKRYKRYKKIRASTRKRKFHRRTETVLMRAHERLKGVKYSILFLEGEIKSL